MLTAGDDADLFASGQVPSASGIDAFPDLDNGGWERRAEELCFEHDDARCCS